MLDKNEIKKSDQSGKLKDTTVSAEEIARFDKMAEHWWDPNGEYKMALAFNEARVGYFIDNIAQHFGRRSDVQDCLADLRILDLGCGGGLVSEALAKRGATVIGIDASEVSVQVAKRHAIKSGLEIDYRNVLARELIAANELFDVVINAEVIEHVSDQKGLVKDCAKLTKPNGIVVLATLNRTIQSFFFGIVGAEYIMRYLPAGTHSWGLFVTPLELNSWASLSRLQLIEEKGMNYNPFKKAWKINNSLKVNYVQIYKKLTKSI
ncbi:bifunctional 2-polyprenyl-6-hydroxyphenol methylase/3-demethylubiquinol 3-O-methyltransferase UbiG [Agaribacter marinus]|uniref:Ubiquinone biosynthesis O-methyltransferase n=1 Tax=Agaribacter marinus TaxID=1431249 RepID=A0AA37T0S6_9ALTE|nr:bifunctional 2-polyprenyl-6-hydroxyphenol methylase/3-demethylubiquinol 3-O-methyltransferase UbiG [Agaribacter marinus]GLR71844.1 ubiquinone biosynthesis O-methyltransferase [Agaribacter marinus]